MDDSDAPVPVPDTPSATTRDHKLDDRQWDSDASVLREKWDACYRAEMPRLIRYLMKCFGDADMRDATDAAQSAFTELFANWHAIRTPRPWLWTVAFRQMLRQNASPGYPLEALHREPAAAPASARLELREETRAVLARLRQLPLAQRQVLALMYDQFSYTEIAQITGTSQDAVRKNAERARRKMKELPRITLGDRCPGGDLDRGRTRQVKPGYHPQLGTELEEARNAR